MYAFYSGEKNEIRQNSSVVKINGPGGEIPLGRNYEWKESEATLKFKRRETTIITAGIVFAPFGVFFRESGRENGKVRILRQMNSH